MITLKFSSLLVLRSNTELFTASQDLKDSSSLASWVAVGGGSERSNSKVVCSNLNSTPASHGLIQNIIIWDLANYIISMCAVPL